MEPMTIVLFIGKAAVTKIIDAGVKKVMGIEMNGSTAGDWGETLVLAIFTGGPMRPDLKFEQKAEIRFNELENEIRGLKTDIADLKKEMAEFRWQVQTQLYQQREETLWETMLQIDNSCDSFYDRIKELGEAAGESDEQMQSRKTSALQLADQIISSVMATNIANTKLAFFGDTSTGVRGFLDIWKQQALREADLGWKGERLQQIYNLFEAKFTRALLIQAKCGRLMMEAYQARYKVDSSKKSAIDYYADTFYPLLKSEVLAFRDIIESLAVNILPLPDRSMATFAIPDEIIGLLASVDLYTGQALTGRIAPDSAAPGPGRTLPDVPALSGCWGRVVVPGTRWIRRVPGAKEPARLTIAAPAGSVTCNGRLEVRSVDYVQYEGANGKKLHQGYQLMVNNTPRDMDKMVLAQFVPEEVLPPDLTGWIDVKLEDGGGETLAQTKALMVSIPIDEQQTTKLPFGTFAMSFTGGASVRGIQEA